MPGYLTTHVLDTARGVPAEGLGGLEAVATQLSLRQSITEFGGAAELN